MYLDNAATTKIHEKVKEEMQKISFANYNSKYYKEAIAVKSVIDKNILMLAKILGVNIKQLVFTSSASESNNYIIKGLYSKYSNYHFITSDREHKSVLETFIYLQKLGCDVTIIKCNEEVISFKHIEPYIKENTKFVSIMAVNNETGIINDFKSISENLKRLNILFHSDVTQAIGKIKLDFSMFDYVSLSAHKINGPKGVGLAIISNENSPEPLIHGSSQQNGNRAGTLPNELIVGICFAIKLAIENFVSNKKLIDENYERVISFLKDNLKDDFSLNFTHNTVKNIISFRIKNEINQIFLKENSDIISASTGSSCSIGEPSYVLKSHGFNNTEIQETIRISTSLYEEVKF